MAVIVSQSGSGGYAKGRIVMVGVGTFGSTEANGRERKEGCIRCIGSDLGLPSTRTRQPWCTQAGCQSLSCGASGCAKCAVVRLGVLLRCHFVRRSWLHQYQLDPPPEKVSRRVSFRVAECFDSFFASGERTILHLAAHSGYAWSCSCSCSIISLLPTSHPSLARCKQTHVRCGRGCGHWALGICVVAQLSITPRRFFEESRGAQPFLPRPSKFNGAFTILQLTGQAQPSTSLGLSQSTFTATTARPHSYCLARVHLLQRRPSCLFFFSFFCLATRRVAIREYNPGRTSNSDSPAA